MEDVAVVEVALLPAVALGEAPVSIVGVFDGHNGSQAATYAATHLPLLLRDDGALACVEDEGVMSDALERAFLTVDAAILAESAAQGRRDGATALVAVRSGGCVWTAHCGDSRCVAGVVSAGPPGIPEYSHQLLPDRQTLRACALTRDHTASNASEAARVRAAGGTLHFAGCWRVVAQGERAGMRAALAVTRAFGDAAFKLQPSPHVLASPEVTRTQLTPDLRFLILATDGLWDVLTDQAAVDVAQGAREGLPGDEVKMAEALVQAALLRGSMDNVTVIVVDLVSMRNSID